MQAAVVWNPSKTERETLEKALTEASAELELSWFETAEDDPGRGATESALATSPELIFVAGGDGTVRAVAEVLAETENAPALAILPLGTGNLLARNLGVPLALPAAAKHALASEPRTIDFGWVNSDPEDEMERHGFAVMVGFGIDANMIAETDDDLKAKAGWLAYVESLGRAVNASDLVDVDVEIDGVDQKVQAHTIIVGNCGAIQGGVTLLPDAVPDDGKLDVLMLSADGVGGWLDAMKTMVWDNGVRRLFGTAEESAQSGENATFAQGQHVHVRLPERRPFQIDGENIGDVDDFTITIQPAALRVRG